MLSKAEFQILMAEVTAAWSTKDLERAASLVDKIFIEGSDEKKAESPFFRGMIKETAGEGIQAREDWLSALAFVRQSTFLEFSLQSQLAEGY